MMEKLFRIYEEFTSFEGSLFKYALSTIDAKFTTCSIVIFNSFGYCTVDFVVFHAFSLCVFAD